MSFLDNLLGAYGGGASIKPISSTPLADFGPKEVPTLSVPKFGQPLTTAKQAGPPDRLDVSPDNFTVQTPFGGVTPQGAAGLGAAAAQAPAYLRERPVAAIDTLTKAVTGGKVQPVSDLEKFIGGIPLVGPAIGGIGDLLQRGSALTPAVVNGGDIKHLLAYGVDAPDSTPLTDSDKRAFGYKGAYSDTGYKFNTVGDLRRELYARGITPDEIKGVAGGTKSMFDFGDRAVSSNPWASLAISMLTDPTNLLLVSPVGAGELAAKLGVVGDQAVNLVKGTEIFDRAASSGVAKAALSGKQAAAAIVNGDHLAATLPGLAQTFKVVSRSGKSLADLGIGGTKALLGDGGKGLLASQIALASAPYAVDFMADHTDKGTPLGGLMENLRSVADQMENDRPLSQNGLFSMYAAMNFPLHAYVGAGIGSLVKAKNVLFGEGELNRFAQALGVKTSDLVSWAGGRENVKSLVDFMDEKIALGKVTSHPLDTAYLGSIPEAIVRMAKTRDLTQGAVADLRNRGAISMADRARAFEEWYTAQGEKDYRGVRQQWDPQLALKQWGNDYLPLAGHLRGLTQQWGATLGLNDSASTLASTITKEDIQTFMSIARAKAENGYVSPRDLQAMLDKTPLHKIGTKTDYWDRVFIRDAKPVSLKSLEAKLGKLKGDAPALSELMGPFAQREAQAPQMASGRPDLATMGADALNNVLEEGPSITASRMRPELLAEQGLPPEGARTLFEARVARSHPTVAQAEREVPKALAASGFPVQIAKRTLGGWDGGLEPSINTAMSPMPIADLRLAGALAGHVMDQDAVLISARGAALKAAGVEPNSRLFEWGNLPSQYADTVYRLASQHFPDGFTFDPVAGKLSVAISDADAKAAQATARQLSVALKKAIPQDAVGGVEVAEGSQTRAYAEWIGRDNYGSIIDGAVRAGDPRVYAFDARASELAGASERAGQLALSEGGSLGGALGLGGQRLPRTPRDWGDIVPGEISQAGGSAPAAAEELRGAVDAQGFNGSASYVSYARQLDQDVSSDFPLPVARASQGAEVFHLSPEEYNLPLTERPTQVVPASELVTQAPFRPGRAALEKAIQDAYDAGDTQLGQELNRLAGGSAESGGAVYPAEAGRFHELLRDVFHLPQQEADGVAAITNARAETWAAETGRTPEEWYSTHIADIRAGNVDTAGQPGTLLQERARGLDVQATGRVARTRSELEPLLQQEAPAELQAAGMGQSSPLEWHTLSNGSDVAIPGGTKGEFSLWDAWRLKAQQINPNDLPLELRKDLYAKLFRSQARELSNPVDAFNRIAFAQISPQLALLKNEAGLAAIRASSIEDIRHIADMPLEDLVKRVKDAGVASVPIRQQLRSLQTNAARIAENPEWFAIKPGEGTLEYSERVMSVLDGAGMKVGNFSTMLGDPMGHNRGTIDSHMVELLVREGLVPEDVAKRVLTDTGKGIAPDTQAISVMKNGKPNPAVPEYLRDLPWQRSDGKVIVFGKDYQALSEALDQHLHNEFPNLPFRSGGGQWFVWDMERGVVEPHTAVWPGAENLPKMEPEAIQKAQAVAKDAGYFRPAERAPYDPRQAVFWQNAKGATSFAEDGRAILHAFEGADVSTAVHELAHVFRRDLSPELLQQAEQALNVRGGVWETSHEEAFARGFERYLRSGKAPTTGLQAVFDNFKMWLSNIYQKLAGSPIAARLSPELKDVFDKYLTPGALPMQASHDAIVEAAKAGENIGVRPGFNGDIHEAPVEQLVKQNPKTGEWEPLLPYEDALNAARLEGRAPLQGLHPSLTNFDPAQLAKINELEAWIRSNYPRYRLEAAPKIATVPPKTPQGVALSEYNAIGKWLFDSGKGNVFSPVFNFTRWLTTPLPNLTLHRAAEDALMSEVISRGGTAEQVQSFMSLARKAADEHTFGSRGVRLFREWSSLPANTINKLAVEAGLPPSVTDALGAGRFHLLVDRATSRFYRSVQQAILDGGARGQIARGLRTMYDDFQNAPGLHYLYDGERATAKVFYHIFRFITDPRWWTYNLLEADTINAARYGMGATRFGGEPSRLGDQAAFVHGSGRLPNEGELNRTATAGEKSRGVMPAGQHNLFKDEAPGHYSGWNDNRNLAAYIIKAFDIERADSTGQALRNLGENHPVIQGLRDRFGESADDWVKGLDETMYRFDTLGVKGTVDMAARELEAQGLMSVPEMRPLIEQIYNKNQQLYDDIVRNLHGNASRTNLERALNSYWLYWPISYQLKAGKWLLDTLTKRFAGHETNLGGLYAYENLKQKHEQLMASSPEYAATFNDHPELWFAAQMLLPITPDDFGVSLNRAVRYGGSALKDATGGDKGPLGFLDSYAAAKDPVTAAAKILNIGPIYTWNQFQQVLGEMGKKPKPTLATQAHL